MNTHTHTPCGMTPVSRRSVTLGCGSASGAGQWSRCCCCCCESLSAAFTHSTAASLGAGDRCLLPAAGDTTWIYLSTKNVGNTLFFRVKVSSRTRGRDKEASAEVSSAFGCVCYGLHRVPDSSVMWGALFSFIVVRGPSCKCTISFIFVIFIQLVCSVSV